MGLIRFLLALSVVAVHYGGIFHINFVGGPVAVESFFIISGFYMSLILNEKYLNSYKLFISNRFLRLYPVYWVVLLLTIVSFVILGVLKSTSIPVFNYYLNYNLKIGPLLLLSFSNLFAFGQDLVMFAGLNVHSGNLFFTSNFQNTNPALHNFIFVPQAWTLGLELMFYVIAPFLLRKRLRIIVLLILLSLLVRVVLYNYFGLQHDPWTYRFFPTEIAFFLCGNLSYRIFKRMEKQNIKRLYAIVIFSGLILFTTLYSNLPSLNIVYFPFSVKTIIYFLNVLFSIPVLFKFFKGNKLDRQIGELSYPIYISHILIGTIIYSLDFTLLKHGWCVAIFSILFSMFLNNLVANPIETFRQVRAKKDLTLST